MSAIDEKRIATKKMRFMRWAMEHRGNEILAEAKVEPFTMVMRRSRLEWFGHLKRRDETENVSTFE